MQLHVNSDDNVARKRLARRLALLGLAVLLFTPHSAPLAAQPAGPLELRFATLAPADSPLGLGFTDMDRDLSERSSGQVRVRLFGGGAAGVPFSELNLNGADHISRVLVAATRTGIDRGDFIIFEQAVFNLMHQRVFFKD